MKQKFKDGDLVEWIDAGLSGRVVSTSQYSIAVEFKTLCGPKIFSFEIDGRVWCWCVRPQLTLTIPNKAKLTKKKK